MASRNSVKTYSENSFYHIYNRGVEKRNIFLDSQDSGVFLSYLKTYLLPRGGAFLNKKISSGQSSTTEKNEAKKLLRLKNYSDDMELICYALLPNHFHLLVKQKSNVINRFMNSLGTRYGMYFNRRYRRTGVLFQDVYKALLVNSDEQLLHLSRYIHLNPIEALNLPISRWREAKYPSSLPEYFGLRNSTWVKTNYILDYFTKRPGAKDNYENFLDLDIDPIITSMVGIDIEE